MKNVRCVMKRIKVVVERCSIFKPRIKIVEKISPEAS